MLAYAFAFMIAAGGAAVNAALYVEHGEGLSLVAVIFCGAVALRNLVMGARL